jgi:S-adenosylmethionine synthetase
MGDDGETGRGNRANGLITPSRPMSLEAAAGKNPVNHTGKIYNVLAANIAAKASKLKGIEEVYVKIVSQIGRAIDDPHMANVQVLLEDGAAFTGSMKQELNELVNSELESIDKVTDLILQRKASLY